MAKKIEEKFTPEEEEVIGFFMDLIPILEEARRDLDKKNLLDEEHKQPFIQLTP